MIYVVLFMGFILGTYVHASAFVFGDETIW